MGKPTKKQKEIVALYSSYVENGVKLLDKEFGRVKWLKKIDVKELEMGNSDMCICGQIFGEYWEAKFKSFKKFDPYEPQESFDYKGESSKFAISHGFWAHANDYDLLTNLWYIKIVKLKIEAGLIP